MNPRNRLRRAVISAAVCLLNLLPLSPLGTASAASRDSSGVSVPFITTYKENYFLGGVPLDRPVNENTADLKFRISLVTRPIRLSDTWGLSFVYTQTSVWNFWGKSSPFRDNMYQPGIFFFHEMKNGDRMFVGLEHRSNGRPYFGNPVASEETGDDYSRGMNYFIFNWNRISGRHSVELEARAGFGCGVGKWPKNEKLFSQDLFLYYMGYFTAGYRYEAPHFGFHTEITPVWNKSVANFLMEYEWHFRPNLPYLLLQFHYGYDETMCSCVEDLRPPFSVRLGISYVYYYSGSYR